MMDEDLFASDFITPKEDIKNFETGRIKALQEERLYIQKKTFTKWINSFLIKVRMEIEDVFTDLSDGRKLLKLLEIISGEKLGKPNSGRMRVHKVENVNKSLAFLHTKVRLESIGAEDIVDGNPRLILGLIWTIILRFQIEIIDIDLDEDNESSEKTSAKDALLLWCQRRTAGHKGVHIQDFSASWRNGMGFNALIHAHRPDLIDFDALDPSNHEENLNNAFRVAQQELGIHQLLDAEDINVNRPDEKSVMTYVASYYHTFAKMKSEIRGGKRIAHLVGQMMDVDKAKERYVVLASSLLEWIQLKITELDDRTFPNSLDGIQKELLGFKRYRTVEKPPKFRERSEVEALFFDINAKLKSLNKPVFQPPEGYLVKDIERFWALLEKAEHSREMALRDELQRQERLEQLAYKFERKSVLREGYLKEMIQVLSDPRYGSNTSQVDATVKKHEAISADIFARKERFADLVCMADELERETFHDSERMRLREREITGKWKLLLQLLEKHKLVLASVSQLITLLREIESVTDTVHGMETQMLADTSPSHLLAVEDLIHKHALMESQVSSVGDSIQRLNRQSGQFLQSGLKETPVLQKRMDTLNSNYQRLKEASVARRERLDESRAYLQFVQDCEDEEAWVVEKQRICSSAIVAKDLRAIVSLQQKHRTLEDELRSRKLKSDKLLRPGEQMALEGHPEADVITARIEVLKQHYVELGELTAQRRKKLASAASAYQFYSDANEAESWIKEKLPLASSADCGSDEPSATALLARHRDIIGEIDAYSDDIAALSTEADKLRESGITSLHLNVAEPAQVEEWVQETRLVPEEYWEEEPVERTEYKVVTVERQIPQVKALYPFQGQDIKVTKGEVLFLLSRTNEDWWNVRKVNGQDGFVPANYVKEIPPKTVNMKVKKPETVRETKRVKKTRMSRQVTPVKRTRPSQPKDEELISHQVDTISSSYAKLRTLAAQREVDLGDAIKLYQFTKECSDFESWMREKEKYLKNDDSKSVEVAKQTFDAFLTDLMAASKRIDTIDEMVEEFVKENNSRVENVKQRQRQIHNVWDHINRLRQQKERSLEGASSVELFARTCEEVSEWMMEKMNKMETESLGADLRTIKALQRRHDNLERELAPVEDKVKRVSALANSVKASYPHELANVTARQKEVNGLWDKVREKASHRRMNLEDAVGTQILINQAGDLLAWVHNVKTNLNASNTASDVQTADILVKAHQDLGDDIQAHQDEFIALNELATKLLKKDGPDMRQIRDLSQQLVDEQDSIHRGWQEKSSYLNQLRDLQMFHREADQLDAITSVNHGVIAHTGIGNSLDSVERQVKSHDDFENTLVAQEDRLSAFDSLADRLISSGHYDSQSVAERRKQVAERRYQVKKQAAARREQLLAAQIYYEFTEDCDELRQWIRDKASTAAEDASLDLSNLQRKLRKHEAFERELRANEGRLKRLNRVAQDLLAEHHYRSEVIGSTMDDLAKDWKELCRLTALREAKFKQASFLHNYNRSLDVVRSKLDELSHAIQVDNFGTDLRSCKQLLMKHQTLEVEIGVLEAKVEELVCTGRQMASEEHFASENVLQQCEGIRDMLTALKVPSEKKRESILEALRCHEFLATADAELQWISEHRPMAESDTLGSTLLEAQSLTKKHRNLTDEMKGHLPMIDRVVHAGNKLVDQGHPDTKLIQSRCDKVQTSWNQLQKAVSSRAERLHLNLTAQQFFAEADEVEIWMSEKLVVLSDDNFGKDEDATVKLLTKHKSIELELDTYEGLVKEMSSVAESMVKNGHPDAKMIDQRSQLVFQQLKNCQKHCNERRQRLVESKHRHEYIRESDDLDAWINDQRQAASSQDFGQDYEHLLLLRDRFENLKRCVESGASRFNQCDDIAHKLIASENAYSANVDKRQEELRGSWLQLLELMDARDDKLSAAGELHRFNRDVAESLQRIQEKYAQIPDDLGRSLQGVQALVRRHEGFENDLLALEAQLQVLVNDSARLQQSYAASNADHIAEQQQLVVDSWDQLHARAEERRGQLQASLHLQQFSTLAKDLTAWSHDLRVVMSTQGLVRDAASAQELKIEHERVKAEIEAREENFTVVVKLAEDMNNADHYAAEEIRGRLEQLLEERRNLHGVWQQRKVYLDQLIDYHFFMRDAKNLDAASIQQETALSKTEFDETVDNVESELRRHEALERLVGVQNDKLTLLTEHGKKLLQQDHCKASDIGERLQQCAIRRSKVDQMCALRRKDLNIGLLTAQFFRDCAEAQYWIDDKKKTLDLERATNEGSDLEDKIKRLQKHQTFEAELTAHQPRITEITNKGEILLQERHLKSKEIRHQLEALLTSWQRLLADSASCARGLEEAQDILEFNNEMEKVEAWVRDKSMLIQPSETGRDFEHCMLLQRRLDDVDSDMRVDDLRIRKVNTLADKLIRRGQGDDWSVQQRRDELNAKWRALQEALTSYRACLSAALEVHIFDRDITDTTERIHDKITALSSDDVGRDLDSVEALQRKQETAVCDVSAIGLRLKEHDAEARRLTQKHADQSTHIRNKIQQALESWRQLQSTSESRRELLSSSYTLQKFKSDQRDLETWVSDMSKKLCYSSVEHKEHAEQLLQLHQERKAEIDGRLVAFNALKEFGHNLIQQQHFAHEEVQVSLVHLEELRRSLATQWEERRHRLTEIIQFHQFLTQADQVNSWLSAKEGFLNNDDLGDSIASVEKLMRKHTSFEETFVAQSGKLDDLEKSSIELVASKHSDSEKIQSLLHTVLQRRDRIKESSLVRGQRLKESGQFQQFLRNIYDVENWLSEKMQTACDESYRDRTNLQSKMQKHQAFEAELQSNAGRVLASSQEGELMVTSGHYASAEIQNKLDALESIWRQLQEQTTLKKKRLQEAYEALLFFRSLDELEMWVEETENQLASEDHGESLTAVNNLLKRHQLLEVDTSAHMDTAQQARETASQYVASNHFEREEMLERCECVLKRVSNLAEPIQIRRENLEEAQTLHQFLRDAEEEINWLQEKKPLAESGDLGESLAQVQGLLKNHQSFEAEVNSHEPLIFALGASAQHMIKSSHFASGEIESKWQSLNDLLGKVKDAASVRRLRLTDAIDSQQYYTEAEEASKWIRDRIPLLSSQDTGKDLDSALSLNKKLDILERDVNNHNQLVGRLSQQCQRLLARGHFDAARIGERQSELEEQCSQLSSLLETRRVCLQNSAKLYRFIVNADEVAEWINDQTPLAASEDYGKDVEHVQMLINRFETFLSSLQTSEERVVNLEEAARVLIAAGHPEPKRIIQKAEDVRQSWEDLRDLSQARHEALLGAKQVHTFDRNADETIGWIEEKQAQLSTEDYGHDMDSIQTLIRRHQGFERDLAAIKEQIEQVVAEARQLASHFPDARDHIGVKHEDTVEVWNQLLEKSAQRKDRLQQAAEIQEYFDDYRDLMAWINELMAKITSPELAKDVPGAELLISRHNEYHSEAATRQGAVDAFLARGNMLVGSGHFMAADIQEKMDTLSHRRDVLNASWKQRNVIYSQSLDVMTFKRDAAQLETWLSSRETVLAEPSVGASIAEVEELIRQHDDFLKTVESQQDHFEALRRVTLIEEAFERMRLQEEEEKAKELKRREEERLRQIKQREIERIRKERFAGDDDIRSGLKDKMGSQTSLASVRGSGAQRTESMRTDKQPKRTPSFTTRRRTQSFRKMKRLQELQNLPPVEIDGFLERKQELQSGGKKATIRSWKTYYTVLCGQLLCFFKDVDDFANSKAAASPIIIYQAECDRALDYTKKKRVFRLSPTDRSEYLFCAEDDSQLMQWINKIGFHAQLSPSEQLLSYDRQQSEDGHLPSAGAVAEDEEPLYANVAAPPPPSRNLPTGARAVAPPVVPSTGTAAFPTIHEHSATVVDQIYQKRFSGLPSAGDTEPLHHSAVANTSSSSIGSGSAVDSETSSAHLHSSRDETPPPPLPDSAPPAAALNRRTRQGTPPPRAGSLPPGVRPYSVALGGSAGDDGRQRYATMQQRAGSADAADFGGATGTGAEQRLVKRNSVFGFLRRNKKDKQQPAQV